LGLTHLGVHPDSVVPLVPTLRRGFSFNDPTKGSIREFSVLTTQPFELGTSPTMDGYEGWHYLALNLARFRRGLITDHSG
jgi:hypothetical protein